MDMECLPYTEALISLDKDTLYGPRVTKSFAVTTLAPMVKGASAQLWIVFILYKVHPARGTRSSKQLMQLILLWTVSTVVVM